MDLCGLLSSPQLASLDADVRGYLREALAATGDAAEAAELLGPFLAEAEPPATDAEMPGGWWGGWGGGYGLDAWGGQQVNDIMASKHC